MTYKFSCDRHGTFWISIPINEYDDKKNKQICPKCGEKLMRVIEWTGTASGSGDGWYGRSDGGKTI